MEVAPSDPKGHLPIRKRPRRILICKALEDGTDPKLLDLPGGRIQIRNGAMTASDYSAVPSPKRREPPPPPRRRRRLPLSSSPSRPRAKQSGLSPKGLRARYCLWALSWYINRSGPSMPAPERITAY